MGLPSRTLFVCPSLLTLCDCITLFSAVQAAFGPRKGLNLPVALKFLLPSFCRRTRTTDKFERRCLMTKAIDLPARPSLEYLKKLAKQQVVFRRKQGQTGSLAKAQLALARQYGFPSWRKLKAHVELLQRQTAPINAAVENEVSSATFDAVMKAITTRDNRTLAQVLAATPSIVNQTGPHPRWGGRPQPLHVAIESDNDRAFELLLNAGASVNGDNQHYDGWSPLMLAVHWKRTEMRHELICRGATIDLIAALMLGDDRRVTKLLKDPAALRGPFPNSASPLHFARTVK